MAYEYESDTGSDSEDHDLFNYNTENNPLSASADILESIKNTEISKEELDIETSNLKRQKRTKRKREEKENTKNKRSREISKTKSVEESIEISDDEEKDDIDLSIEDLVTNEEFTSSMLAIQKVQTALSRSKQLEKQHQQEIEKAKKLQFEPEIIVDGVEEVPTLPEPVQQPEKHETEKEPEDTGNKIFVCVRCGPDDIIKVRVSKDDKIEKLQKAIAKRKKLKNVNLSFDGMNLKPTQTISQIGIEEEDLIDLKI